MAADAVALDWEAYVESVLRVVESIPVGRVMAYGAIAEIVGVGGPRQVGKVMAEYGGGVPWWRVVRADGTLPDSHRHQARERYLAEGTPLVRERIVGDLRIDMRRAAWEPDLASDGS
ncbi:MAG: MGMT family protein [Nocardioidaceae bacterium]